MIVIEKNEGKKIPFFVKGNKITIDDDLTINVAKREQDWDVHIDICYDINGDLCIGSAAGRSYVAQIDIPKRSYIEEPITEEDAEAEIPEDSPGGMRATVKRTAVPLDMDTVTLTLWAI